MKLNINNFGTDNHGWAEFLPARKPHKALSGQFHFPWVVIGAGVTGLSTARRLAQLHPADEILLIDARQVAQGASGRNSGFAVSTSQFSGGFETAKIAEYNRINHINNAGLDILKQQVAAHNIECQWSESGFHHTAADTASIEQYNYFIEYLQVMEIAHTRLTDQDLQSRLGTSHYKKGVHVPGGVLLQPALLVRGLAESLPGNVKLVEQNPVLEIRNGTPHSLHLKNAIIKCDKLILATNYESGKLGHLRRRLIGSTLSGSFTRKLNNDELASLGNLDQWGILSLHGGGATIRLTHDRRICIRNTAEYCGAELLSQHALDSRRKIHRQAFELRFPQLRHVQFEYSWSGVEGISSNGTNFFGKRSHNVYLAAGFNGSGVTRGTAFGFALAEYASGGQSQLINDCLANPAAPWLPPRPFLDIGAYFTVRSRFKGVGLDR